MLFNRLSFAFPRFTSLSLSLLQRMPHGTKPKKSSSSTAVKAHTSAAVAATTVSINDGYTNALVLQATEVWWPSLHDLTQHPLLSARTFYAAVTDSAVGFPVGVYATDREHSVVEEAPQRSVGLSRLGRSVFLTAEWASVFCDEPSTENKGGGTKEEEEEEIVSVFDPFTGQARELHVCMAASTVALADVEERRVTLAELVRQDRVRLVPRTVAQLVAEARREAKRRRKKRESSEAERDSPQWSSTRQMGIHHALFTRYWAEVTELCQGFLRRVARTLSSSSSSAYTGGEAGAGVAVGEDSKLPSQASPAVAVRGRASSCLPILVRGDHGSGKRAFSEFVRDQFVSSSCVVVEEGGTADHSMVPFTATTIAAQETKKGSIGRGVHTAFVVEARRVNCAELLTLDEREAVSVIRTLLRPPPLRLLPGSCCPQHHEASETGKAASTATPHFCCPLLFVQLEQVDLLWFGANPLTAVVSAQLCASIDTLLRLSAAAPSAAVVLWSTATDLTRLAPSVLRRVAGHRVELTAPSTEERRAFLQAALHAYAAAPVDRPPPPLMKPSHFNDEAVVELVVSRVAGMSMGQLAVLSPEDVVALYATTQSVVHSSVSSRTTASSAVYAHLFGMDDAIHALEELLVWPLTHLALLRRLHVPCAKGALVTGSSGTGKTLLLTALAKRLERLGVSGVHVVLVDGLTLIEKEVGRSEKNIAAVFATARARAPTALFLDNLDALAPPRGRQSSETTTVTDRTLSTLLTEMDGIGGDPSRVVVVIASAPSKQQLDPAVCRPGRLDVHVELHAPPLSVTEKAMVGRLSAFVVRLLQPGAVSDVPSKGVGPPVESRGTAEATEYGNESSDEASSGAPWMGCLRELVAQYLAARVTQGEKGTVSAAEAVAATREVMLHMVQDVPEPTSTEEVEETTVAAGSARTSSTAVLVSDVETLLKRAFAAL